MAQKIITRMGSGERIERSHPGVKKELEAGSGDAALGIEINSVNRFKEQLNLKSSLA